MIGRVFRWRPRRPEKPRVPAGVRVYVIGDIHGRADLLDEVHAKIRADVGPRRPADIALVYLGDYVDRGADSCGVVERLCRSPIAGARRILLKGNHEDMLLRFLHDPAFGNSWRLFGGMETLLSYKVPVNEAMARDGLAALREAFRQMLPPHHLELLRGLKPCDAIGDYFFCHAGVRPGVALERQREEDLMWIREEFLHSDADFGKVVVHGHSPVPAPEVRANRINIDTGAYVTHRLTCLVLEEDHRRFLSTDPRRRGW